ncbi:MAG: DUF4173 domain-containing protein, partial [Clostridia bacterium]|nr:DUF4173 domain-containing protein [Clostridia bacterium]
MTQLQNPTPAPIERATPSYQPVYGKRAVLSAWLSLAIGYLYCRTVLVTNRPFIAFIFTFCLFLFVAIAAKRREDLPRVSPLRAIFYPISALILNLGLFLSTAPFLRLCIFTYSLTAFLLFCHLRSANRMEKRAGGLYLFDLFKAVFLAPFTAIAKNVTIIVSDKRGKKLAKGALFTICGLAIALIPTLLVLALLSFDDNFTGTLESIFNFFGEELFGRVLALLFGLPVGMYLCGAVFASNNDTAKLFSAAQGQKVRDSVAFFPPFIGLVALLPLLFLYGVFIFAQKDYYAAVFSGVLPDSHTFSSFARDGFFRLLAVALINLICLVCLRLFSTKSGQGKISPVVTL